MSQNFTTCNPLPYGLLNRLEERWMKEMGLEMDKKIKSIQKTTDKLVSKDLSLLKADKKNDKIVDKAKKIKGKC